VVHHGAGLKLKPKASAEAIAAAVRRVLDEPSFAAGARRIADAIAVETAEDLAANELEELAAARQGSDPTIAGYAPELAVGGSDPGSLGR